MRSQTVLFVLLLLALTGCGGLSPASAPTSTPPSPDATPIPLTPAPTPTREAQPTTVTLRLWLPEELNPYNLQTSTGLLAEQLASFSEIYSDVHVEVVVKTAHGRGGLLDFLRTARDAAPSVMPDLMVLDAADLETAAASNLIHPLDDLLSPSIANDRFPFATEMGQVGDRTMGFMIGADLQHMVYRPHLFDSPVITWTAVISAPASFLFPAGGRDRTVNDATLIQYLAAGGSLTDPEGRPWLDRDVLASVFSFYDACVGTSVISPAVELRITDADQAWERFQEEEYGLVITDLGMPGMSGDALADRIRGIAPGVPVVLLTGWMIDEEMTEHFSGVVKKPVDVKTLHQVVARNLQGGGSASASI